MIAPWPERPDVFFRLTEDQLTKSYAKRLFARFMQFDGAIWQRRLFLARRFSGAGCTGCHQRDPGCPALTSLRSEPPCKLRLFRFAAFN
jgi:hypothetical protein